MSFAVAGDEIFVFAVNLGKVRYKSNLECTREVAITDAVLRSRVCLMR